MKIYILGELVLKKITNGLFDEMSFSGGKLTVVLVLEGLLHSVFFQDSNYNTTIVEWDKHLVS